jgi:hypothetical protein
MMACLEALNSKISLAIGCNFNGRGARAWFADLDVCSAGVSFVAVNNLASQNAAKIGASSGGAGR